MLDKITDKASSIKGLDSLSAITQVILLIDEVEFAKGIGISNTMICSAINSSGGKIKPSYFTEALHHARKRAKKMGISGGLDQSKKHKPATPPPTPSETKPLVSPKQARDEKAKEYVSPVSNNPILRKLAKDK